MRRLIRRANYWLIAIAMMVLTVVIFTQVFFRYVLNDPLTWPEELGRYIFVWIVFLGLPDAYRQGKHLGMDILTGLLPTAVRRVLARVVECIILAFAAVAAFESVQLLALTVNQTSPVLRIPMAVVYLAFTVGFALVCLDTVAAWFERDKASPGRRLYRLDGAEWTVPPEHVVN